MNNESFNTDDIQTNESFVMEENDCIIDKGELDLDMVQGQPEEKNELFELKCDIIEKAIEETGLHISVDDEGQPYGGRGTYYTDERISVFVDRTKKSVIRLKLDLFAKSWEDEDFDFAQFYDIVSNKCYVSLQNVDDEWIEFRSLVPDVSMDILPILLKSILESSQGTVKYFDRLMNAYHELYC